MSKELVIRTRADIERDQRMPEAGRIRIGEKLSNRPTSIDTIRFTSPRKDLIEALAAIYGGVVQKWDEKSANPPNQWQVKTTSSRVRVVLTLDCLSQWYEDWAMGKGCVRRCDGEVCSTSQDSPDGAQMVELPCLCAAEGALKCKMVTRLSVIIPDIPFTGVWRLDTKSGNAAVELPGMVAAAQSVSRAGFTVCELGVEARRDIVNGQVKHFVVPTISLIHTPEEIAAGAARLKGLDAGGHHEELPALPAPRPSLADPTPADDGIIDAEAWDADEGPPSPLRDRCYAQANKFIVDPHALWVAINLQVDGDLQRVEKGIEKMEKGELMPVGIVNNKVQWGKP